MVPERLQQNPALQASIMDLFAEVKQDYNASMKKSMGEDTGFNEIILNILFFVYKSLLFFFFFYKILQIFINLDYIYVIFWTKLIAESLELFSYISFKCLVPFISLYLYKSWSLFISSYFIWICLKMSFLWYLYNISCF